MNMAFAQKMVACLLIVLLAAPLAQAFPRFDADASPQSQQANAASGAGQTQQVAPPESRTQASTGQDGTQAGTGQQPARSQKPVGTAAAPYEKATGVTGSRPAGAVIAPAKQRRMRAFLIKIGIVVGAAATVGAVVALSHASPSQPH